MMQSHLDRTRAETAAISAQVDKAKRLLEGLGSIEIPKVPEVISSTVDGKMTPEELKAAATARELEVWATADAMFL